MPRKNVISALEQARRKDLRVQNNSFKAGWSITMPNGMTYHAKTDADMVAYVKGY